MMLMMLCRGAELSGEIRLKIQLITLDLSVPCLADGLPRRRQPDRLRERAHRRLRRLLRHAAPARPLHLRPAGAWATLTQKLARILPPNTNPNLNPNLNRN